MRSSQTTSCENKSLGRISECHRRPPRISRVAAPCNGRPDSDYLGDLLVGQGSDRHMGRCRGSTGPTSHALNAMESPHPMAASHAMAVHPPAASAIPRAKPTLELADSNHACSRAHFGPRASSVRSGWLAVNCRLTMPACLPPATRGPAAMRENSMLPTAPIARQIMIYRRVTGSDRATLEHWARVLLLQLSSCSFRGGSRHWRNAFLDYPEKSGY